MAVWSRMRWAIWLPILGAAAVAVVVASHVSHDIPFDSDEANHANIALRQFQDLRDGRFMDFVRHSYRTGQFPFLHGWTILPWFAACGTTLFAARLAQCLLFVLGAAATAWAAYRSGGDDERAAAVAGGLFATSPLLATYSGLCMLETPGAALTALALAAFAEACRSEGRRATLWHAAAAVAALATYFVKINYGLWIIPALVVGHLVRLRAVPRGESLRHALVFAVVLAVAFAVWYSTEGQRAAFMGFLHNPSQVVSIESDDPTFRVPGIRLENFTAYFGLVAAGYHVHAVVGVTVFGAFACGVARGPRNPAVAAAVACLAWTWLVLSMGFREYPMARFVATALPALWIVAAIGASELLQRVADRVPLRTIGAAALGLGIGAQAARLPGSLAAEYETDTRFVPVFDFLAASIPPKSSVLAVGYTDHTSARTLDWWLGSRPGHAWRDFNVVGLNSERIFESPARLDDWMTKPRPWGAAGWATYVVEFVPGPAYPDHEIVQEETARMWHDAVGRYGTRLVRADERRFEDLDLTVTVWRDTAAPPHQGHHGN